MKMQKELKEKLSNLNEKFNTDLDIISLKALCTVPENEEILFAITGTLNRLMEKYPDDEEILDLLPKKEKISLEELINLLEKKYSGNVEVITIKALSTFPEEELREKAISQSLERLLEENSNDENILDYLGIEDIVPKEKNPDMVFVEGGIYSPSFYKGEVNILDLYVNKYTTIQEDWEKLQGKLEELKSKDNLKSFVGERKPTVCINWIEVLEYCNKMSEKYGLQPVYNIEYSKEFLEKINLKKKSETEYVDFADMYISADDWLTTKIMINQLDGKKVPTNLADFSKTEGYRLPTEAEWEWFALGGKMVLKDGRFLTKDKKTRDIYGWFSSWAIHEVGTKKPNELGLYDIIGNVWQLVYDTADSTPYEHFYIDKDKAYFWDRGDSTYINIRRRGGNYNLDSYYNPFYNRSSQGLDDSYSDCGFRVVRTANPKRK